MENKKLCSICKGHCCKSSGCELSPEDFKDGVTYEAIKERIDKGLISIDWWEGNVFQELDEYDSRSEENICKSLFLRMRNKNAPVVDPSFGGECVALTANGCKLSYDERPKGGRALIPDLDLLEDGFRINCHSDWSKKESAIEWYTYRDILAKLMKEYFDPSKDEALVFLAKRHNINLDKWQEHLEENNLFSFMVNKYLEI